LLHSCLLHLICSCNTAIEWKCNTAFKMTCKAFVNLSSLPFLSTGGVLKQNEIFNNKFDGISLATGVEAKLIGKYHITN